MSGNRLVWNRAETPAEINRMLSVLAEEYPVADCGDGMRIRFEKIAEPGVLRMAAKPGTIVIQYGSLQAAARGVGNALAGRTVSGDMVFKTLGIMLDCSRNAVMKVSYLRKWLRRLTLLGYNMVMLYTEDTYQLPEEPYFGYLRGGYSLEEMREIDAYASGLGIEMIGCIQTLGHLEHIIRWHAFPNDSERVLLVDDDRTYALIGKMLDFWGKAFKSRRIHVGMDETHDLGRGRFMDLHGYERGFDIFNRHLGRVNEMCKERGLNPIIWSDMYFRMGNKDLSYYDKSTVIPEDVRKKIPSNVTLCYWDYYHRDQEFYEDWIQRHRALGFDPHMGSGVWTWVCMWYDHEQTVNTVTPCLNACRKEKVSEIGYHYYNAIGQETGVPVVKKEYDHYTDANGVTYYNLRVDSYALVGFAYVNLSETEYNNLMAYQNENDIQVIYPLQKTHNSQYMMGNGGANFWYQLKDESVNTNGDPALDENGSLIPNYLTSDNPNKANYNSKRIAGDDGADGQWYTYAQKNQTGYRVRVHYLEYFRYVNGYEPTFIFGTNNYGQDIFTCLAVGARLSFLLSIVVASINFILGVLYGSIEGYYGGAVDMVMERISDVLNSVPFMVVATLFQLHLAEKVGVLPSLLFAFVLTGWVGTAARVRTQFYRFKGQEYVLAARTLGASDA